MINYSIIIPHYNSPKLLQRCLDSIPIREDVEVIIVDDNSDIGIVSRESFPGVNRANTQVIFSDGTKGKGPGYARNEGLRLSKGKWIIFSDADDYMLPSLSVLMDKYVNNEEDVIYFRCTKEEADDAFYESYDYFDAALKKAINGEEDELLYYTPSPCCKFIKRDYIIANHIKFQQITGGDDILFSIDLATYTNKRAYIPSAYYCVVMAPNSLTRTTDWHRYYNFTIGSCAAYDRLLSLGKTQTPLGWIRRWWIRLYAANRLQAIRLLPLMIKTIGWRRSMTNIKKGILKRYNRE